ncbi:MAG: DUF4331 family protein, partial [Burkholderiales bacterium]|nr:DUF4331 family protein [Burkholderiales bacterium]
MHRHTGLAAALLTCVGLTATGASLAASHREAPGVAADPTADITDVYAFVSYDATNLARAREHRRVTF